jgi:hypothetical protein
MSISPVSSGYYLPVTPVAPVRASSRTPERKSDEVEPKRSPPPQPPPSSRPPPEQGQLFDIRA